jgi:hypothetical protein
MKVRTRTGYAKNGNGDEMGESGTPERISSAVVAKRIALATPTPRTRMENSPGMLTRRSAVAHKAVPAANEGGLSLSAAAAPDMMTPSPIAKTRNPDATRHEIIRPSKVFQSEQACGHRKAGAVDAPKHTPKGRLVDGGPREAEYRAKRETDHRQDV